MGVTSVGEETQDSRTESGRGKEKVNESVDAEIQELMEGEQMDRLPLDDVFDILSNERRRFVIRYLEENSDPVTISDLSEALGAHENDLPVDALSSKDRKRVYVALQQCHLPKMAEKGAVQYDKSRGKIKWGEHTQVLGEILTLIQEHRGDDAKKTPSTLKYILGLAGLSILVLAVNQFLMNAILSLESVMATIIIVFGIYLKYF